MDLLRNSYQPFDSRPGAIARRYQPSGDDPRIENTPIMQQVLAVDALTQGRIDEAHRAIDLGIELQMSWLNYVLLGKVYEMQGQNHLAADSAFNLRPGEHIALITNGVFQTSLTNVVPYLNNYQRQ